MRAERVVTRHTGESMRTIERNPDAGSELLVPDHGGTKMGRGILLWLLGVPIPIIILLALFWH